MSSGTQFPDFFRRHQRAFEAELEAVFDGHDDSLYSMMRHQLGWDGERMVSPGKYVRPGLLLLACEACGGDWREAVPGAVALELLHNFSLIHDDIQDESPTRRGRPTVWDKWGAAQAINAGDGMYALSRLALLNLMDKGVSSDRTIAAARLLDQTCVRLCAGQFDDIAFQERPTVTMADYEGMVANKTAAVFACALEMGAIVAVGQGDVSRRLADAGRAMGIAYQMRDDVLDLWGGAETGKQVGIDLRRGKKSLPVVFGLSQEGTPEGERVRAIYSRPMTDDSVESVTRLLEGVDAPSFCMAAAEQHWDRSKSILRDLGLGEAGARSIIEAGELLVQRES